MDLQSLMGYARNSPFRNNPYLDIHSPEGIITMEDTDTDLLGIDNTGQVQHMKAGRKKPYKFRGSKIREIPYQAGGRTPIYTQDPNDSRLKAYNDSLALHDYAVKQILDLKNEPTYPGTTEGFDWVPGQGWVKRNPKNTPIAGLQKRVPNTEYVDNLNRNAPNSDYFAGWQGSYTSLSDKPAGKYYNFPIFKKPVQPVVYQKPQQQKGYSQEVQNAANEFKQIEAKGNFNDPNVQNRINQLEDIFRKNNVPYTQQGPNSHKWQIDDVLNSQRSRPIPQRPQMKYQGHAPVQTPNLGNIEQGIPGANPAIQPKPFGFTKPTKYSFTNYTGETQYFPTKSMLESFMSGARKVSSQEGQDYKTATGYYQAGGNVFTSQQQIDQANAMARRLGEKYNVSHPDSLYVGRDIGDPIPPFVGNGYQQQAQQVQQLPSTVPAGVQLSDIKISNGQYWYDDPTTGNLTQVNPGVVNLPRFRQPAMKAGGLTASKAQEMLDNPPKNQPMTKRQKRYFQAVAHGWKPTQQMGGVQDAYNFLYEDEQDTPDQQEVPTAPSTDEIPEAPAQEESNDDQENDQLALSIAMGDFSDTNPYVQSNMGNRQKGVNPYLAQTENDIFSNFAGVKNLGIWGDTAHQMRKSDHNTGDAQDFGVSDPTMGKAIIDKLMNESKRRNVKYIIYNGRIWNPSVSSEWRKYSGPDPHTTHIHVSYNR